MAYVREYISLPYEDSVQRVLKSLAVGTEGVAAISGGAVEAWS